jgi:hypothetical protein
MQWVITKTSCDGIGNIMKGFISALSVNSETKIQCNPEYIYGHYDTVLDEKHIYKEGDFEPFYTCRLLVLKSEESNQENIVNEFQYTNGCGNPNLNHHYSLTKLIDWNYDAQRVHPTVRNRILQTIQKINFRPEILYSVNKWTSQFRSSDTLGISVRTWKAKHEQNIHRSYDANVYKQMILNNIQRVSTVILSVDTDDILDEYTQFLRQFPVDTIILKKSDSENDIQFAFIKAIVLSKCKYLIGNRISTFTELVYWLSGCRIEVLSLF